MASIRQWLLRIVAVFRHGRAEDDLAREVNSHLELLEEKFRAEGLSPQDAGSPLGARLAVSSRPRSTSAASDGDRPSVRNFSSSNSRWALTSRRELVFSAAVTEHGDDAKQPLSNRRHHSLRSATTGSTRVACLAGR